MQPGRPTAKVAHRYNKLIEDPVSNRSHLEGGDLSHGAQSRLNSQINQRYSQRVGEFQGSKSDIGRISVFNPQIQEQPRFSADENYVDINQHDMGR